MTRSTIRAGNEPRRWRPPAAFPITRGKNDLAIALAVYRLQIVQHSRVVTVSNAYLAGLGIDRYAKYRGLRRLAKAGLFVIRRRNKRALEIEFLPKRNRHK